LGRDRHAVRWSRAGPRGRSAGRLSAAWGAKAARRSRPLWSSGLIP